MLQLFMDSKLKLVQIHLACTYELCCNKFQVKNKHFSINLTVNHDCFVSYFSGFFGTGEACILHISNFYKSIIGQFFDSKMLQLYQP